MRLLKDIYWAAGFIEGEGSFSGHIIPKGNHLRTTVQVAQVQREPLDRLQKLFGGHIWFDPKINARKHKPNTNPSYRWTLGGPRARGLMMTIYTLMSPKRKIQIRAALDIWKTREVKPWIKQRAISG